MTMRVLVDGQLTECISALDRSFSYGDGLFETLLFVHGVAPMWSRHLARLAEGCARLHLPIPGAALLAQDCASVVAGFERAAARIHVSRGVGERGYAPPSLQRSTRVVLASEAPVISADWYRDGIRLRCCDLRLASQPLLAGIKHASRLEQVLARAEWTDPAITEGVLFDANDRVIGATAANVFAVINGRLATPALDRCGVAGVTRAEILSAQTVDVREISRNELMQADEVFLSSALRGILPVVAIDAQIYAIGAVTRTIQTRWFELHGETV